MRRSIAAHHSQGADMRIPFSRPPLGPAEVEAVAEAIRLGRIGGNGEIGKRVEAALRGLTGSPHVLLTPSATQAMDVAFVAMGLGPGDEVLMPSFAFVSQANAILARGARPVFCEVDPLTLNMCPEDAARRVTDATRIVMPVHYAGIACDLDAFRDLADDHGLMLFEDAAQCIGATWRGRALGTIGDAGCYSFHETKNVVAGEGGCLFLRDAELAAAAEIVREKGTNRSAFLRGEVDKYTWVGPGGSYVTSDLLSALLEAQLERLEEITAARHRIWRTYHDGLEVLEKEELIRRPFVPDYARHNAHIYGFRARSRGLRSHILSGLQAAGIGATFHFQPLHAAPFAREVLGSSERLPVTEEAAETLVRLPLFPDLPLADAERIVDRVVALCED
jgi:dTDP-4-amino-4,6-dideoxygalactose transaminase